MFQQFISDPAVYFRSWHNITFVSLFLCFLLNIIGGHLRLMQRYEEKQLLRDLADDAPYLKRLELEFMEYYRVVNCLIIFLLVGNGFQFLQLNDNISPFIDIFYQIFADIKHFMLILIIFGFACANCFWLLALNQWEYDQLTSEEFGNLAYSTLAGSAWYIWQMVLGNGDDAGFSAGAGSQEIYLDILFSLSAFVMVFHLMNMLIAIMGNTFAVRSEIAGEIRIRDHLNFVIDNWYLSDLAFTDKNRLKFIVIAFQVVENQQRSDEM